MIDGFTADDAAEVLRKHGDLESEHSLWRAEVGARIAAAAALERIASALERVADTQEEANA